MGLGFGVCLLWIYYCCLVCFIVFCFGVVLVWWSLVNSLVSCIFLWFDLVLLLMGFCLVFIVDYLFVFVFVVSLVWFCLVV